jgi:nitrate reductase gamma subunit
MTLWNGVPIRLFLLESTALAAALLTLFGLGALIVRRAAAPRLRVVTSAADILVYVLLLFEIGTGLWVAITLRWGSAWYTQTVVPYLWSLVRFQPEIQLMVDLKLPAQIHVVGAWVLLGVFSFTRLVHALVAPVPYLWRPNQLVVWNRPRGAAKR